MYTSYGVFMVRTQIYLTDQERKNLTLLSQETGKPQSALIREAIDQFIEAKLKEHEDTTTVLHAAKGLWSHRTDLPNFRTLRTEWDRAKEK